MKGYEYTSPFAKQHIQIGRDEGIKLASQSLLKILRIRGIDVSEAARQRIVDEKDITRIERWLDRADTAPSLAEVFADPS